MSDAAAVVESAFWVASSTISCIMPSLSLKKKESSASLIVFVLNRVVFY